MISLVVEQTIIPQKGILKGYRAEEWKDEEK